jgi:hypothetical protein
VTGEGPEEGRGRVICFCCGRYEGVTGYWCCNRGEGVREADWEVDSGGEVQGRGRVGEGEERVAGEAIDRSWVCMNGVWRERYGGG